jgi:protein involved in polysaccharide export with SLBB domain
MPSKIALAALAALFGAAALPFLPPLVWAQQPNGDARRMQATRPELEATLERLRQLGRSGPVPAWLDAESSYVHTRLDEGDFRAGDRVLLAVEDPTLGTDRPPTAGKSQEQQLSDTFTVGVGQEILLPVVGAVSLRGTLRSELEPVVTRAIGRYLRDPVVHARPLVSVGVTGEVARPGFYGLAPDAVVSAVLNAAGGPTKDAKMDKLKIERDGRALFQGKTLRRAIEQGATLDALQLRSGDQLIVPSKLHGDMYEPLRFFAVLLSIPVTIYTLTHLH